MSHRHEGPRNSNNIHVTAATAQFIIKIVRDLATFIIGAYAFIHELARTGSERPQILIMSAALMGLPLVMRGDEKRQEVKQHDSDPEAGG